MFARTVAFCDDSLLPPPPASLEPRSASAPSLPFSYYYVRLFKLNICITKLLERLSTQTLRNTKYTCWDYISSVGSIDDDNVGFIPFQFGNQRSELLDERLAQYY